jgi:type IV pilus assembly protein PilM
MMLTALNISSRDVKYLVARGNSVIDWGSLPLPDVLRNGVIRQPELAGEQLKSFFASKKLPREKVVCSLNGLPFSYRFASLPRMAPASLNEAVMRVARQEIPLAPDDMYVSWETYRDGREEWECLVLGVARPSVDSLVRTLAAAGIKPYLLEVKHLLLARLAGRRDAIIVDFEPDFSAITLVAGGIPVGMHTVPSLGQGAQLQDETDLLLDELTRMVGFYNDSHAQSPIPGNAVLLLTGELSADPAVAESIKNETGYRVEALSTPLDIPPELPVAGYAANIGAALKLSAPDVEAGAETPPARHIDLGRIARERKPGLRAATALKAWLLPAALVVGVGLLAGAFQLQHRSAAGVAELQTELALAEQQLTQSQARLDRAGEVQSEIDSLTASALALQQRNAGILAPEEYVSDLARLIQAMPSGMSFSSLEMPGSQIVVRGITAVPAPVVEFARNIEASGEFAQADIIWIKRADSGGISFMVIIGK